MFELQLKLKGVMGVEIGREKQGDHSWLGKLFKQRYRVMMTEKNIVG